MDRPFAKRLQLGRYRLIVLGLVLVVALLGWLVVRVNVVVGRSMVPTLQPWELCVSLRVHAYEPNRGDIVTFRTSDDPPLYFVKRVIGLPGETVAIENGRVKINHQPLEESYTTINPTWDLPATPIPTNKVYVLSDNRTEMFEDYVQGMVAARLVQARLLWHWRFKR